MVLIGEVDSMKCAIFYRHHKNRVALLCHRGEHSSLIRVYVSVISGDIKLFFKWITTICSLKLPGKNLWDPSTSVRDITNFDQNLLAVFAVGNFSGLFWAFDPVIISDLNLIFKGETLLWSVPQLWRAASNWSRESINVPMNSPTRSAKTVRAYQDQGPNCRVQGSGILVRIMTLSKLRVNLF